MTSGLPFDDYRALLKSLPGPDVAARDRAIERTARLSAGGPSLGRLGEIAQWLATWSGRPPQVARPVVALFAGTHGIVRDRLDSATVEKTQAMVEFCAAGGAAISQLCGSADLGLKVFDLALDLPVADITREPALDERGCAATMAFGMEAAAGGADLMCIGNLGTGAALPAAAILCALHGGEPAEWTGDSSGALLVSEAVALNATHAADPLEVLRRLGGREFAAIAGAILAARTERVPVILDGIVPTAAAAVLHRINPAALDHCLLGHVSDHPAHARAAKLLGLKPVFDLGLGDGEGLGAGLAAILVRQAAQIHAGMAPRP